MTTSKLNPVTEKDFAFSINEKPYTNLHNHDHYEITIVTKGTVGHYINDTRQILPCNTALFLRPQDTHFFYRVESLEFEYVNLVFPLETLQDLLNYIDNVFRIEQYQTTPMPPMIQLSSADTRIIRNNVKNFTLIAAEDKGKKKTFFRLILADLFFKYFQTPTEETTTYPLWFHNLIHKMNEPENFRQGVSRMEELSGKNPAYICRVFKENLQTTPTDYINELRLNYCANRLIHSDAEILDIAMDAGFNNLSHFYHLFKDKYHISPSKYRKDNLMFI